MMDKEEQYFLSRHELDVTSQMLIFIFEGKPISVKGDLNLTLFTSGR